VNSGSNNIMRRNPALAWREIEEEIVIISPAENIMHELNDTGGFLWKRIDGKRSAMELAELLAETYDVAPAKALEDTEALLNEMLSRKLLVPADGISGEGSR
jgi:hypothetical protein